MQYAEVFVGIHLDWSSVLSTAEKVRRVADSEMISNKGK